MENVTADAHDSRFAGRVEMLRRHADADDTAARGDFLRRLIREIARMSKNGAAVGMGGDNGNARLARHRKTLRRGRVGRMRNIHGHAQRKAAPYDLTAERRQRQVGIEGAADDVRFAPNEREKPNAEPVQLREPFYFAAKQARPLHRKEKRPFVLRQRPEVIR